MTTPTSAPTPPAELDWRRVHPITPVVRSWTIVLIILLYFSSQIIEALAIGGGLEGAEITEGLPIRVVLLALLGVVLLASIFYWLSWRKLTYAISDDAVHLHKGIIFRQRRQARLDRLQAVDTVQPLLARLFGLIELKVEVAGGSSSSGVAIGFLSQADAAAVRNEILMRAAGLSHQPPPSAVPPVAPEAPERFVYRIQPSRLLASLFLSWPMAVFVLVACAVIIGSLASADGSPAGGVAIIAVFAAIYVVSSLLQNFDFTAAISADGIRIRHGMLEKRAQTVPPGRIQAIELSQPLLWRPSGMWRMVVNVAGYGTSADSGEQSRNVILPAGRLDEALLAAWLVMPDLGVPDPATFMTSLLTKRPIEQTGLTMNPKRSIWLDPLIWKWNGFTMTERAVVIVHGLLQRRVVIVPHERTQSLGARQGPLLRSMKLATLALHSVSGPVRLRMVHLDEQVATQFLASQAERASQARRADTSERWMATNHE